MFGQHLKKKFTVEHGPGQARSFTGNLTGDLAQHI
jgi:hypothetical protein